MISSIPPQTLSYVHSLLVGATNYHNVEESSRRRPRLSIMSPQCLVRLQIQLVAPFMTVFAYIFLDTKSSAIEISWPSLFYLRDLDLERFPDLLEVHSVDLGSNPIAEEAR